VADPVEAFAGEHDALLSARAALSQHCVQFADSAGRVLFVNHEGAQAMGATTPRDLIGRQWIDHWPEPARSAAQDAWQSARRGVAARFSAMRPGARGELSRWEITLTPIDGFGDAVCLIVARDVTGELAERERAAIIAAEMRHRLRNSMATAAGIVTIAVRSHPECQPFARDISERFAMIAKVQDLLLDPARDKSFAEIVPLLTSAYGGGKVIRFGAIPDVQLSDGAMQALALAFGELATNSLKYGALKNGRSVEVDGELDGDLLRLTWHEPTTFGPPRRGAQGLELVNRLIEASRGEVMLETGDGRMSLQIALPYR